MATFVSDTFTDTDAVALTSHTGETGASWTRHTSDTDGTAEIKSNRVVVTATGGGTGFWYASGTPSDANYYVQADLTVITDAADQHGVAGRVSTSVETAYYLEYRQAAAVWRLRKVVAGAFTTIGTWSETFSSGTRTAKLDMNSSTIKGFVDATERISTTDTAITAAGKAGLLSHNAASTTTGRHWDNYSAVDGSAPPSGDHPAMRRWNQVPHMGGRKAFGRTGSW